MKVRITREWIYLDSETEKETRCLERFIFGDKKRGIPAAKMLFMNGAHFGSSGENAGMAIRKLSEIEQDIEAMERVGKILGKVWNDKWIKGGK